MLKTLRESLFDVGFALLFAHELDAVRQSEWRLLYGLNRLPESVAYDAFVLLHVPLMMLVLGAVHHGNQGVRLGARMAIAVFMGIHAGLHYRLRFHPLYTFNSWLSQGLIFGAGLLGLLYCLGWAGTLWRNPCWRTGAMDKGLL